MRVSKATLLLASVAILVGGSANASENISIAEKLRRMRAGQPAPAAVQKAASSTNADNSNIAEQLRKMREGQPAPAPVQKSDTSTSKESLRERMARYGVNTSPAAPNVEKQSTVPEQKDPAATTSTSEPSLSERMKRYGVDPTTNNNNTTPKTSYSSTNCSTNYTRSYPEANWGGASYSTNYTSSYTETKYDSSSDNSTNNSWNSTPDFGGGYNADPGFVDFFRNSTSDFGGGYNADPGFDDFFRNFFNTSSSYNTGGSSYNTGGSSYGAGGSSYRTGGSSYGAGGSSYGAGGSSYGTGGSVTDTSEDQAKPAKYSDMDPETYNREVLKFKKYSGPNVVPRGNNKYVAEILQSQAEKGTVAQIIGVAQGATLNINDIVCLHPDRYYDTYIIGSRINIVKTTSSMKGGIFGPKKAYLVLGKVTKYNSHNN